MIKLKSLLPEGAASLITPIRKDGSNRNTSISTYKAIELRPLFSTALDAHLNYAKEFYRNVGTGVGDNIISNPRRVTRKSKDAGNLYYVLMDNLPSWKPYPSRSKSLIFTNHAGVAADYPGKLYNVYPKNGAKIGVGYYDEFLSFEYAATRIRAASKSVSHISTTFMYFIEDLAVFTNNGLLLLIRDNPRAIATKDYSAFINTLTELCKREDVRKEMFETDPQYGKLVTSDFARRMVYDIQKNNKDNNWEKYFDELLNPEKNDFRLITVDDLVKEPSNKGSMFEYWTDSVCYLHRKKSPYGDY
jgi:hypothetical protein